MKFNEFINSSNIKSLLIAFFNITKENDDNFEISSDYRESKFATIDLTDEIILKNNELLRNWSNLDFKGNKRKQKFIIEKDETCQNLETFINKIYKKIQISSLNIDDEKFNEYIALSMFALRGSADPNTGFYALDIYRNIGNQNYYEKILKLISNLDTYKFNLNFRELQKDFNENNRKRNTQIRIFLDYFVENFAIFLKDINVYKYNILESTKYLLKPKRDSFDFIGRMMYYEKNILGKMYIEDKKLLDLKIKEYRDELEFSNKDVEDEKQKRSSKIVKIANIIYPDECVSCKNIYNLDDRTFKLRNSNNHYLEIHHVVSFASNKSGDQIDNLVKLCPACHRALTPNRADENYQKEIIRNILENSQSAYSYVQEFFENPSMDKMIDFVYERLS